MNYLLFKISILCAITTFCFAKISDQRRCGDADCANPVSYAKTLLRYSGDDPRLLSFKPGEKVIVYSKSAGSRDDLWGVEIGGKRGYAPKGLLREERILTSTLNFVVPTEPETAPHIASSVAPIEVNAANPTESYEVVDGTTLYYDNVGSTAVPEQITTPSPFQEKVEEYQETVEIPQQTVEVTEEKLETPQEKVEVHQEEIIEFQEKVDVLPQEEIKEYQKKDDVPQEEMKDSQEKEDVPQEEINDSQEKVEGQEEEIKVPQKEVDHQETADNHQDKVEDHQGVKDDDLQENSEDTQEEGSAQRIYKYITSLLPSEGSGFLSSSEDQAEVDAGRVVDEAPGSGEGDDATSEEEPEDETNSEETDSEEETSEELTDNVVIDNVPSVQPAVGQASSNAEADVDKVGSNEDGNNNVDNVEKQMEEVILVTEGNVPESSTVNVPEPTLEVDEHSVPASSVPDVHEPDPVFASATPDPVPASLLQEPVPAWSAPEPVPPPAYLDSSTVPDPVSDVPSLDSDPLAAEPDPIPAMLPDPVPAMIPDPVPGTGSDHSSDTGNDQISEPILATSAPPDIDHIDQYSDSTSTPDPGTVPTPDTIPNIYPNPNDFMDTKSDADPNNDIEKTEESQPVHVETPLDQIIDKLQLDNNAPNAFNTPYFSFEESIPSINSTLEPNNTDPGVTSDDKDETMEYKPAQLPWDVPEDSTTENSVNVQVEHDEVATPTETPMETPSEEDNSSPGFFESIMNMFSGSATPPPTDEVAEDVAVPDGDEAMQGDQPVVGQEDPIEYQPDVSEEKPWWGKNPLKWMNEDSMYLEPSGSYYGILYIAITAMAVLVFTLGYYRIENSRQDSFYVGKINKLERALHVSNTECLQIREEMEAASSQATSRVHVDEDIRQLQEELDAKTLACQDLEERMSLLNAELDAAMETGEELNRMLGDYLADNQGTGKLRESVDSLQQQLASQQTTISATNTLIFNKNMENELLCNEVSTLKDKLEKMKHELSKSNEICANLRAESMQQQEQWTRSHGEELLAQKSEVARLEKIVSDLIERLQTSDAEIMIMQECVQKINHGDSIHEMLDLGRVTARLETATKKCEAMSEQLAEETGARKLLEDHLRVITQEIVVLTKSNAQAEKDKTEAITKLDILTNYFKDKEAQLQKDIDMHEALFKQKSGDADSMYSHMKTLQEQSTHAKSQIEMLKKECDDQERSLKEQIFVAETKAHENWVAARQAERKCEEMKQEAAILRNRLTLVETQLAKSNQMLEHPPMVNDRVPIEGNGEMHMSPHHMQYMDLSYSPRPYMPPPLYEPDERLPPLGCLPTAPLPPPPAYSRPRHYESSFRPLPPQNRSRRTGSNSSGHSSGSIEKSGSRKQFDS